MSDADKSVYDLIAATWVPPMELPQRERCTVSGTDDISQSLAAIKQWLEGTERIRTRRPAVTSRPTADLDPW